MTSILSTDLNIETFSGKSEVSFIQV